MKGVVIMLKALNCLASKPKQQACIYLGGLLYITSVNNILELTSAVRLDAVGRAAYHERRRKKRT